MLSDTPRFSVTERLDCPTVEVLSPCKPCLLFRKWFDRLVSFGVNRTSILVENFMQVQQDAINAVCTSCFYTDDDSCECFGEVYRRLGLPSEIPIIDVSFTITHQETFQFCAEDQCFRVYDCTVCPSCTPYILDPCIDRDYMESIIIASYQNGSAKGVNTAIRAFWGDQASVVGWLKGEIYVSANRELTDVEKQRLDFVLNFVKRNQFAKVIYCEPCDIPKC